MPALADLTSVECGEQLNSDSVVVLPIGSLEQHGPHLPVSTDLVIAEETARALDHALRDVVDLWRLPSLAFSKSDEHAGSPGTVWLSWDTMMRVLVDVGRSLAASAATRLVFLNGHGGNSALLQVACRELRREFGLKTFLMHPQVPTDQGGRDSAAGERGMGIHGGFGETSVMLHLRPELVRLDLAVRSVPDALADYEYVGFGRPVSFGWLAEDFGTNGTIGDPSAASAAAGAETFEAGVRVCAAAMQEVARFDPRGR